MKIVDCSRIYVHREVFLCKNNVQSIEDVIIKTLAIITVFDQTSYGKVIVRLNIGDCSRIYIDMNFGASGRLYHMKFDESKAATFLMPSFSERILFFI